MGFRVEVLDWVFGIRFYVDRVRGLVCGACWVAGVFINIEK